MKRKTTKEILAESFRELAETKKIDKITIQDITDNCGYSPATFYRNFKDKYDLIAWDYAGRIEEMISKVGNDNYEWRQTLLEGLLLYRDEKEYLVNLLMHTNGHDSFIRYMAEYHIETLSAFLCRKTGAAALDRETALTVRLYCMGTASMNADWILGKLEAGPEELADIYEKALPSSLRALLLDERN